MRVKITIFVQNLTRFKVCFLERCVIEHTIRCVIEHTFRCVIQHTWMCVIQYTFICVIQHTFKCVKYMPLVCNNTPSDVLICYSARPYLKQRRFPLKVTHYKLNYFQTFKQFSYKKQTPYIGTKIFYQYNIIH